MDVIAYFLRLNIRYAKNQACKFLLQIQFKYNCYILEQISENSVVFLNKVVTIYISYF